MKYGIRECADVVLRAKHAQKIGNKVFYKDEPVCYFDTLKTSSLEGSATTVYAQGGRGNSRLMSWDGERNITFTMEDALISPEGLAILTGAGLISAENKQVVRHITETFEKLNDKTTVNSVTFTTALNNLFNMDLASTSGINCGLQSQRFYVNGTAYQAYKRPIRKGEDTYNSAFSQNGVIKTITNWVNNDTGLAFCEYDADRETFDDVTKITDDKIIGSLKKQLINIMTELAYSTAQQLYIPKNTPKEDSSDSIYLFGCDDHGEAITEPFILTGAGSNGLTLKWPVNPVSKLVLTDPKIASFKLDYYTEVTSGAFQIDIEPDKFGGSFYLEASTLWRDLAGQDHPAEFIIPNCRVQSNFTFTMASSGDPSSFTFTLDAFPDYTRWDKTKKVLAQIQVFDDLGGSSEPAREETWSNDVFDEDGNWIGPGS